MLPFQRKYCTSRPVQGEGLDLSHWLCRDLIICSPLNEGGGKIISNLAANASHAGVNQNGVLSGALLPSRGLYGPMLAHTATDTTSFVAWSTSKCDFERTDRFSFEVLMFVPNVTSRALPVGNAMATTNVGIQFDINGPSGNGSIRVVLKNTTTTNIIDVTSAANVLTAATWNHIVITYDGSSSASGIGVYLNGVSLALTITTNNLSATIKTGQTWSLGRSGSFQGVNTPTGFAYAKHSVWARTVSYTEVRSLYANPWQMFYRYTLATDPDVASVVAVNSNFFAFMGA